MARLTLVISTLGPGGAERVLVWLAGAMAASGHAVTIVTIDGPEQAPFYDIDRRVEVRRLGVAARSQGAIDATRRNAARVRALRTALVASRPDVIVSFIDVTNVLTLLAARPLGVPVVVSERSDPQAVTLGRAWRLLRRWTYGRAARVVVQTEHARTRLTWVPASRVAVIPNPVHAPGVFADPARSHEPRLVAMGRLGPEKGFDLLIDAYARVAGRYPSWTLAIAGEGPLCDDLARRVDAGDLTGRVRLEGLVRDAHGWLASAQLFALPSRYEGFPNVLCEAMAVGLPVVAFDCPSGPREIVTHGVDGLLVAAGDVSRLAEALASLMGDAARRARLGQRARTIAARLAPDVILSRWAACLFSHDPA